MELKLNEKTSLLHDNVKKEYGIFGMENDQRKQEFISIIKLAAPTVISFLLSCWLYVNI